MRVIDDVEARADGSHLTELWARRQPFYPADDIDLLQRFMIDALRSGEMAAEIRSSEAIQAGVRRATRSATRRAIGANSAMSRLRSAVGLLVVDA